MTCTYRRIIWGSSILGNLLGGHHHKFCGQMVAPSNHFWRFAKQQKKDVAPMRCRDVQNRPNSHCGVLVTMWHHWYLAPVLGVTTLEEKHEKPSDIVMITKKDSNILTMCRCSLRALCSLLQSLCAWGGALPLPILRKDHTRSTRLTLHHTSDPQPLPLAPSAAFPEVWLYHPS